MNKEDLNGKSAKELKPMVLELSAKVEELEALQLDPEGVFEKLSNEITEAKTENANMRDMLAEADARVAELKASVEEQNAIIKELSKANAAGVVVKPTSNPVVSVKGKKYEVRIPKFRFKGKDYKAADVTPEIAEELIAIKSSAVAEIK